jgi:hypothetical protein
MTTFQELAAQQAALAAQQQAIAVQMAAHEKPLIEAAIAALASNEAAALKADLAAIIDQLPEGQLREQIGNVTNVIEKVPIVLAHELNRVNALIPGEEPGEGE